MHTWTNGDGVRALGNGDASKHDIDRVRSGLNGSVGAAEHAVAFVLHHDLHGVPIALGVLNDRRHITHTSTCYIHIEGLSCRLV